MWKTHLTKEINLISSKDNDEEGAMQSKSDKIETMINDKEGKVIEVLFQSVPTRY